MSVVLAPVGAAADSRVLNLYPSTLHASKVLVSQVVSSADGVVGLGASAARADCLDVDFGALDVAERRVGDPVDAAERKGLVVFAFYQAVALALVRDFDISALQGADVRVGVIVGAANVLRNCICALTAVWLAKADVSSADSLDAGHLAPILVSLRIDPANRLEVLSATSKGTIYLFFCV